MTTTLQVTAKDNGASAAGQILAPTVNIGYGAPTSIAAGAASIASGIYGGDSVSGIASYCGFRRTVTMDLSARKYLVFQAATNDMDRSSLNVWAAGGGMFLVLEDSGGNWAAYSLHGGDNSWGPFSSSDAGYFGAFAGFGAAFSATWSLDRARTPDFASGTLDWAAIAAYEVHFRPVRSARMQAAVGRMQLADPPVSTGAVGNLFADIAAAWSAGTYPHQFACKTSAPYARATAATVYCPQLGFQVGDGVTATTGTISNFSAAFWNAPEDTHDTASPYYVGTGGFLLLSTPRLCDVYQSASDSVVFNDGAWASSRQWGVRVRGNTAGVCAFNRNIFTRPAQFECGHGQFTDCSWDGHTEAIEVTVDTTSTRGTVRNGVGHGIKVTSGPGNYAGLDMALDSNSTYDVELGSGGAGTYAMTGLSVLDGGYALKLHNDSANDVVVELQAGISYTTSTSGGSITVTAPSTFIDAEVTAIEPGSTIQVYNETTATEIANEVVAGTSWSSSTLSGEDYTPGDVVRVRLTWCGAATAKLPFQARAIVGATGWSVLAEQEDDSVYAANGIDGSTVTEFTADYLNVQIDVDDLDGSTKPQRGYAWYCSAITTANGIANFFGAMTAESPVSYIIEDQVVDMKLQNVGASGVTITDASLRRRSGDSPIAPGGSIYMYYQPALAVETGVSGLTGVESDLLAQAANAGNLTIVGGLVQADVKANNGTTIKGDGTTGNKWRSTLVA